MVVKAVRGRRRYVVFTVPDDVGRSEVQEALSSLEGAVPELKVITSFGGKAVVRCVPDGIAAVTKAMEDNFEGSESLLASGTLRKLRDVYPELKVKQKRKR